MGMKFKSKYWETPQELTDEKERLIRAWRPKRLREKTVRAFMNGLPTMTEQEAENAGRTEIVNYLTSFRAMGMRVARLLSTLFLTDRFVDIKVVTGNTEEDFIMGETLTTVINQGIIHENMRFIRMCQKLAGELQITGTVPVTFTDRGDWLPKLSFSMLFPPECGIDPNEIPYAFTPRDMTLLELKRLESTVDADNGVVDKATVKILIDHLYKQMADETGSLNTSNAISTSFEGVLGSSVTPKQNERKHTIPVWVYHEVKSDNDRTWVSATWFTQGLPGTTDSAALDAVVFAHAEEAFASPEEWIYNFAVDSEIGGDTTLESLRGVAEIIYPSSAQREELLNLIIEGDKMRAKPRVQEGIDADVDSILKWNPDLDVVVPKGITPFDMRTSTSQLQTPLAMLTQNEANLTAGDVSNPSARGGELRQQALERQSNNGLMVNHDLNVWYIHMTAVLERCVERVLTMDIKPGNPAYNEIMWVRTQLELQQIPYAELAKKAFGRFLFLKVRCNRVFGDGDVTSMDETATWLMDNIQNYSPTIRPMILRLATSIKTRDPMLAGSLVPVPNYKINQQRVVAENEADTIMRRALLGEILPINPEDVPHDHLETHMIDMKAMLANNEFSPWNRKDAFGFAGLMEHAQMHLKQILDNPVSANEGNAYLDEFSQLVRAGQALSDEMMEREQEAQQGLTPKEQAELQLKMRELMRKEQEFGLKVSSEQALQASRQERADLMKRKNLVNEILADRKFKLDRARIALEAQRNQTNDTPTSPTKETENPA